LECTTYDKKSPSCKKLYLISNLRISKIVNIFDFSFYVTFLSKKCGFEINIGSENYVKGDFRMLACRTEFYPNDRFFAAIAAISLDLLRDRSGHRKK